MLWSRHKTAIRTKNNSPIKFYYRWQARSKDRQNYKRQRHTYSRDASDRQMTALPCFKLIHPQCIWFTYCKCILLFQSWVWVDYAIQISSWYMTNMFDAFRRRLVSADLSVGVPYWTFLRTSMSLTSRFPVSTLHYLTLFAATELGQRQWSFRKTGTMGTLSSLLSPPLPSHLLSTLPFP